MPTVTATASTTVSITTTSSGGIPAEASGCIRIPAGGTHAVRRAEAQHFIMPSRMGASTGTVRSSGKGIADELGQPDEQTTQWLKAQIAQTEEKDKQRLDQYEITGVISRNPAEKVHEEAQSDSSSDEKASSSEPTKRALDTSDEEAFATPVKQVKTVEPQ